MLLSVAMTNTFGAQEFDTELEISGGLCQNEAAREGIDLFTLMFQSLTNNCYAHSWMVRSQILNSALDDDGFSID